MYIGSLVTASNRATFQQDFQLYDDEDDEGLDLTGATITLEVRRPNCSSAEISATTTNGLIAITDSATGVFELTIPVATMRDLDPGTYEVGITVLQNDETTQYFIGTWPVLDGIVA